MLLVYSHSLTHHDTVDTNSVHVHVHVYSVTEAESGDRAVAIQMQSKDHIHPCFTSNVAGYIL